MGKERNGIEKKTDQKTALAFYIGLILRAIIKSLTL
jgi:hypothetical protein